jgi:hypothetical protein
MLKLSYTNKEEIPDDVTHLYNEVDGVWTFVGVEGQAVVAPDLPNKFKEFRDNNRKLNKSVDSLTSELDSLRKQYDNIDPEVYDRILRQSEDAAADEDKTLLAQGRVEEVVQRRVKSAIGEVRDQLASKTEAYEDLNSRYGNLYSDYSRKQATDHIMSILDSRGHRPRAGAKQDVEDRIAADWSLSDDQRPVPKAGLVGEDGGPIRNTFVASFLRTVRFILSPLKAVAEAVVGGLLTSPASVRLIGMT